MSLTNLCILIGIVMLWFIAKKTNVLNISHPTTYEQNKKISEINDLTNLIDLYPYNPQQYMDMEWNINMFFLLYEDTLIDNAKCFNNYTFMERCKNNSLNALMSIIYKIPSNEYNTLKINNLSEILDNRMTQCLGVVEQIIDDYQHINGFDINTQIIDRGPKASNQYNDSTYEIY